LCGRGSKPSATKAVTDDKESNSPCRPLFRPDHGSAPANHPKADIAAHGQSGTSEFCSPMGWGGGWLLCFSWFVFSCCLFLVFFRFFCPPYFFFTWRALTQQYSETSRLPGSKNESSRLRRFPSPTVLLFFGCRPSTNPSHGRAGSLSLTVRVKCLRNRLRDRDPTCTAVYNLRRPYVHTGKRSGSNNANNGARPDLLAVLPAFHRTWPLFLKHFPCMPETAQLAETSTSKKKEKSPSLT